MMYVAFFLVYLVTSKVTYYTETSKEKFKDLQSNNIDIYSDCGTKPCVLKCCNEGEVLNEKVYCNNDSRFKEGYSDYNYNFSIYSETENNSVLNLRPRKLNTHMFLVTSDNFVNGTSDKILSHEFYILQDGSIRLQFNQNPRHVHIAPLQFCVEYTRDAEGHGDTRETAVVFLSKNIVEYSSATDHLLYFSIGMVSSMICLTITLCRMPSRTRNDLALILAMSIISIMAAYILKITELCALITNFDLLNNCRIISPGVYFFVLASCFWSNLLFYDMWWRLNCMRQKIGKFHDKYSCLRITSYCSYGFGIPLLMTTAAVAVDKLNLYKISWFIQKSPFDTCFANETSTTLYLSVPISILILLDCVYFVKFICLCLEHREYILDLIEKHKLQEKLKNITILTTKHRNAMIRKMVIIILVTILMDFVTDMSVLLYITLHIYNLTFFITFFVLVVFKRSLFTDPNNSDYSKHFDDKFQAKHYLKDVKAKIACATFFSCKRSNSDKKQLLWTTDIV